MLCGCSRDLLTQFSAYMITSQNGNIKTAICREMFERAAQTKKREGGREGYIYIYIYIYIVVFCVLAFTDSR